MKIELKFKEERLFSFVRKNVVFFIAFIAAAVTCIFVPIDTMYGGYFDYKTLTCLFCMLLVVAALKNIGFFIILSRKLIKLFKNTRACIAALVFVTYFASMLIANDMALITFLPLGILVLNSTGKQKYMIFTFIMQNIAANLGGMLTPFGNPQNLYLYNFFQIDTGEFFRIMLVPFLISAGLILICCLAVKKEPLSVQSGGEGMKLDPWKTALYTVLFVYAVLIVFRLVPFWTGLLMIPVVALLDRKAVLQVDYILLLTFCLFFIFAGNLARIEPVKRFLTFLMEQNTLLTGVLSCQLISNVPSAVLLSSFTADYANLLRAVNIAGCGTLISSLASLITFKQFSAERPREVKKYLLWYHVINFSMLAVLVICCLFV